MSEDNRPVIQPQTAPLSHLQSPSRSATRRFDWRSVTVALVVMVVVVTVLLWQPDIAVAPTPQAPGTVVDKVDPVSGSAVDTELAPFANAQKQRAREMAQESLARFVERQIQLEESMAVGTWGETKLQAAMETARRGDTEFVDERFEEALATYDAAGDELAALITEGERLFRERLDRGMTSLQELQPEAAVTLISSALEIKPDDAAAQDALRRAQQLPQIIALLRDAKNHELGGRYENALAVYEEVRTLDPQTPGLNTLIAAAQRGQTGEDLTTQISRGFAALEGRRFADARSAFQAALRLDPNNDIARGGLQQVARQNDLTVIRAHQQQAEAAMSGENWQSAIDAYQAVLALDGNIQFAANGLNDAKAHLRAQRLLTKIASEPSKLSSESLFLQANDIVQSARELQHKGPTIDRLVNEVNELLTLYRDPVDVVLISDNATEIIVSNVGRLGRFERKNLSLRPGQYTIRGSQDGCRDIYLSVEVLPGIAPLNLSCPESLE